jgi:hypothetical protein
MVTDAYCPACAARGCDVRMDMTVRRGVVRCPVCGREALMVDAWGNAEEVALSTATRRAGDPFASDPFFDDVKTP